MTDWPPLIHDAKAPRWVAWRDVALTALAWALLAYQLREPLFLAIDYLRAPIFEFSSTTALPDWGELWGRLRGFSGYVAVPVVWLLFWALARGRHLGSTQPSSQPAPLPPADHAASFGLDPASMAKWREARVLVVHFDAGGKVSHADVRRAE